MSYLTFITDENLEKIIKSTLDTYNKTFSEKVDIKRFNKNIIDPIKYTFDSVIDKIVYNREIELIIDDEIARQLSKTNNNEIGYFHQEIFRYIENCTIPLKGFDIIFDNHDKQIFIELKNKHNTMNSSSSKKIFDDMVSKIKENQNCECYLVEVIAKKSQNIVWKIEKNKDERIRRVSIDKFYEIVTGESYAFMELCKILPQVITKIVKSTIVAQKRESNTVLKELQEIDKDVLKAMYLLAFKEYKGFDKF